MSLDLGFLDFLFVFSLGKTVPFSMCKVIKSFSVRGFRFRICRFSLFSVWAKRCRLACAKSSHHFHCNCVILSLFGKKKKKLVRKMTWQLTAKSNWGCDLLMEPNVGV